MKLFACVCVLVLALLASTTSAQGPGELILVVGYCPTAFTSGGAIVKVDPSTGKYQIVSKFEWPKDVIFGCLANYDPSTAIDRAQMRVMFDFMDDFGQLLEIDVLRGQISANVKPDDSFFTGFENFVYIDNSTVKGASATVRQDGPCFDGCFTFGSLTTQGHYTDLQDILFKALMDDSHFYDTQKDLFYVQASYDLRQKRCAPKDSDLCLLTIDGKTGATLSAVYTNYTAYSWAKQTDAKGRRLAWLEGFDQLCRHPYNNYLFGYVDLQTAEAVPIACIPHTVVVDMDEFIGSFSLDGSLFATGSGDAETGKVQLLVFETNTGNAKLSTELAGLPKALGAYQNLVWVWGVDFF